jgi:hypothetical protein
LLLLSSSLLLLLTIQKKNDVLVTKRSWPALLSALPQNPQHRKCHASPFLLPSSSTSLIPNATSPLSNNIINGGRGDTMVLNTTADARITGNPNPLLFLVIVPPLPTPPPYMSPNAVPWRTKASTITTPQMASRVPRLPSSIWTYRSWKKNPSTLLHGACMD